MANRIELSEADVKKVIYMLKMSKKHINIPNDNLFLYNLWRVSDKLAEKLMRKAGLVMVAGKGRDVLRPSDGCNGEPTDDTDEVTSVSEEPQTDSPSVESSEVDKPHRCRKRRRDK